MNIVSTTNQKTPAINSPNNHNHAPPQHKHAGVGPGHIHTFDGSASYTYGIVPEEDICVYYNKYTNEAWKVLSKDNLYSWEGNQVLDQGQLCDMFGDILGSQIQDGGDINLFKSMLSERIKEVVKEFTPEDIS